MCKLKRFFIHLHTISEHRKIVRQWAKKMGIASLGREHDKSKYSKREFCVYKYATGKKSPHEVARDETGESPSWIFHKNTNPHHWEYWVTFNNSGTVPVAQKIPYRYVIEMFCDMISTGKVYLGKDWKYSSPLEYYQTKCLGKRIMNQESEELLLSLLTVLKNLNNDKLFFYWYKRNKRELRKAYNYDMKV